MSDQKISIIGASGKIVSDQKNRGLQFVEDINGIQDVNPYFSSLISEPNYSDSQFFGYGFKSISQFVNNVKQIVRENKNYKIFKKNNRSFEEAKISTAIIEAANKSLKSGKKEKIYL